MRDKAFEGKARTLPCMTVLWGAAASSRPPWELSTDPSALRRLSSSQTTLTVHSRRLCKYRPDQAHCHRQMFPHTSRLNADSKNRDLNLAHTVCSLLGSFCYFKLRILKHSKPRNPIIKTNSLGMLALHYNNELLGLRITPNRRRKY